MRSLLTIFTTLVLLATGCQAFVGPSPPRSTGTSSCRSINSRKDAFLLTSKNAVNLSKYRTTLFSGPESQETETTAADDSDSPPSSPSTSVATSVPEPVVQEEESSVPIDLPSPLLLATSIILGIISTGSLFDLIGGSPSYGFAPTAAVSLLGLPLCFYIFYAAIQKGQQETEEDDKNFSGRGF